MLKKIFIFILLTISFKPILADGFPPAAEQLTLDHGFHTVGKVWQVVSNIGGYLGFHCFTTYAPQVRCVYPVGSGNSYLFTGSFCIAAKRNGRKLFSTGDAWSRNSTLCAYEFFPSGEPWDHVYTVFRGDTVDIPYYPNFTPRADQALVMRYNDFTIRPPDQVSPLFLEVIQVSHQWASTPFDEWILFEYFVFPVEDDLTDVWLSFWAGANLIPGDGAGLNDDNLTYFDEERNMGIVEDLPGGQDDNIAGPIGFMMFPPDNIDQENLRWTFNNSVMIDHFDDVMYDVTAAGTIEPPSLDGDGRSNPGFFRVAFGPIDLAVGDTAHFFVAEIFGDGANKELARENFLANADRMIWLKNNNFQTPSAPPPPEVSVRTDNHTVTLDWSIKPGGVNPESYQDPVRLDNIDQPFEGYRVYKSTQGLGGPWTLLREFDIADNEFGINVGLEYQYTDVGLVNNLEYFYSVVAFSKPDTVTNFPSQESTISGNAIAVTPGTAIPETVGKVAVVPNPYRGDVRYQDFNPPWEKPGGNRVRWTENDRRIQFINLPSPSEIKIYTMAGDLVETIQHNSLDKGFADWNLTSSIGQTVASGIYLFTVEDLRNGNTQVGKFVIIK